MNIGITGSIGNGKSTVALLLHEFLNIPIFNADKVAHECMKSGSHCFNAIVMSFKEKILSSDGEIDRAKLGNLVFHDVDALKQLNAIIHPHVFSQCREAMERQQALGKSLILDIPLLFETDFKRHLDYTVVVVSDEPLVAQRLFMRSKLSASDVQKRMRSQMSNEEKVSYADFVINNNGSLQELKSNVLLLSKTFTVKI